ncbi:MAG: hypothetical protein UX88_C0001G0033 [Candidatus Woesebacteria bacterium GW2011_GWC2_47_16]|uniref:Uncharacterized protein n=8 Tax=Candidatus Woeseibacteriota TaxID=1752722 RepID=A0A0G1QWS2_9BACT|nr:MAG: hypothetical protein UX03_C0003G0018 [Candidatus Woesebacteria bacterium GW2011_GWE1_45_18]KKU25154.1 MAG: hypothetical protein UX34_C0002G0017 [Candidatus Woesebacteria bacterium GW2011_GWF1_46_13]KKU49324.1 MAG: hypothetical protein UX67_C0002G0009 [Candidatus Woesebacteria bacterium GW2011_GWF2_46_8]KKU65373.1 MAG: hypothetical protein UX88_C0001G0033 [Candidatus Woesebacteria bacterium GW2011_GWC2_47_16]KKU71200.1 MAG: hypothetical protein UX95_C0002G0021 [Candidatus Woesebacteria b
MANKNQFYNAFTAYLKKNKFSSILILIFLATIAIVLIISLFKTVATQSDYVYAKVKVSQGLWWISSQKPGWWFVNSLKKGEEEFDILGKPIAEILEVRYYPTIPFSPEYETEYNIYVTLKLAVNKNTRTQTYLFKRSQISVGRPIELEFPSTHLTGSILELSEKEFGKEYSQKVVTITKKLAYPWEYDAIKVGDKQFDGENHVFEVINKNATPTSAFDSDPFGNIQFYTRESRRYITVRGTIMVRQRGGELVFGEEQVVKPGNFIYLTTSGFVFDRFLVESIR